MKRPSRERIVQALSLGLAFASVCIIPVARPEALPMAGLLDARIRIAPYSADEVYRLTGFVGFQIDLEFEMGETFVGLAAGDIEGLSFVAQDNHLFLKPRASKVGTNLTIVTSRRAYQLDYSASARRPDATQKVIYALRFTYPRGSGAPSEGVSEKALQMHRPKNLDYWYCGSPALQPIAASDDGVRTHLRFASHAEQPAIFVMNEDASESLVNFSMHDGDVILHRIAHRLILRRGNLTGCIVNKGFVGGGERMQSNTASPDVERTTMDARP